MLNILFWELKKNQPKRGQKKLELYFKGNQIELISAPQSELHKPDEGGSKPAVLP